MSEDFLTIVWLENKTVEEWDRVVREAKTVRGVGTVLIDWAFWYRKELRLNAAYSSHGFYTKCGFVPINHFEGDWVKKVQALVLAEKSTKSLGIVKLKSTPGSIAISIMRVQAMTHRVLIQGLAA